MPIRIGQPLDRGYDEPLGLLSDCHRRIEHFLQVLDTLAATADAGPLQPGNRADLQAALTYFTAASPKHIADEEESLFPRLRASNDPAAAEGLEAMARLEDDHRCADGHHRAVDALAQHWLERGVLDPPDTRALREHLAALRALYAPHIAVEERQLFPAAARLLSADELAQVGREMAKRRSRRG